MASRKDSRLRTVQRESGKVFVVMFGIKYAPSENTQLKVGDDVEVVEGSQPTAIILRRAKDGLTDEPWNAYGIVGGEKAKAKALEDWRKFLEGEKSHAPARVDANSAVDEINRQPVKERLVATKDPRTDDAPDMTEIRELAKDYDFSLLVKRVAVRFKERSGATSFKIAATRRGWKVSVPLTDENTGETEVLVQSK